MSSNTECLLLILRNHGNKLTTANIVEFARQYPDICKGCSSGSAVISAALTLVEEGQVIRETTKGGFVWSLNNQN